MTPLRRFYNLLILDKKDVYQILFYAAFAGLISLSLPLGIQAIINFIQSGQISVSWIVLIFVVTMGVAFGGILSLMQLRITENLQQKIFVRSSFEFACRFPKIKFNEMYENYPPELANRFFDTLSIQKGTSKLLLDFTSALLQISFGIILLSVYHPFFILFGILLILLLYLIFRFSYDKGIDTSLSESKFKYKAAYWIQEIARNSNSFKKILGFEYALKKNDDIVDGYIGYREKHFNVIKKQYVQLIIFKVIITASLLSIGGYLVIKQQMNIGQFVAAEIIILLVINSVEKIIIGLETFYDVLTSVEKIGLISDMAIEQPSDYKNNNPYNEVLLETKNLSYRYPGNDTDALTEISLRIEQGERIFVGGGNGSGKSTLLNVLAGYIPPNHGSLYVNDGNYSKIDKDLYRSQIGVVMHGETPFEGTIKENITFNDPSISRERLREVIKNVQLTSYIKSLSDGLDTHITPDSKQLSASNAQKIILARNIIHNPKVLILENPTDKIDEQTSKDIVDFLFSDEQNWTIIVSSVNTYWKSKCDRQLLLSSGEIIEDFKH